MEKYQIPGLQTSFRLKNEERSEINDLALLLQNKHGIKFNNAKELFLAIIDELKTEQSKPISVETIEVEKEVKVEVLPERLQEKFEELKTTLFEGEETYELQILETMQQIISTPTPAVEIPVEKIVEKEKELSPTEILLQLKEPQMNILQKIAEWRFSKRLDPEKLTPGMVIKRMVFNQGSLTNWHDEFETGIRLKEAQQL